MPGLVAGRNISNRPSEGGSASVKSLLQHWKVNLVTVAGYTVCLRRFPHFGTSITFRQSLLLESIANTTSNITWFRFSNLVKQNVSSFSFRSPQPWQTRKCGNKSGCVGELNSYNKPIWHWSIPTDDFSAANNVTIQVHTMAVPARTLVEDSKFVGREGTPCRVRSITHDHPEETFANSYHPFVQLDGSDFTVIDILHLDISDSKYYSPRFLQICSRSVWPVFQKIIFISMASPHE